jgi:hypothetical protein
VGVQADGYHCAPEVVGPVIDIPGNQSVSIEDYSTVMYEEEARLRTVSRCEYGAD